MRALAQLGSLDTAATEFEPLLTEVISSGLDHLEFEEQEVWPLMRQAISSAQASALGREIAQVRVTQADTPPAPKPHWRDYR